MYCKHCGELIDDECIICPKCGKQVQELKQSVQPNIIINNDNTNVNKNENIITASGKMKNKWVSFVLCLFLGYFGAHKFYEGKIGMGILYLFTFGICGIGWLVDIFLLLFNPNPYFVK